MARDDTLLHTAAEGLIVATFAAVATWARTNRTVQAIALALGLMSASAILVHLSGGYIELHFHFFVMLGGLFQPGSRAVTRSISVKAHRAARRTDKTANKGVGY